MTRLSWGAVGERFYEIGVDRGVLYVDDDPGVPWNGLISVTESPSGGEARPYYQNGVKYLNLPAFEEFEATLQAFFSPKEFDAVDGSVTVEPGLIAAHQKRRPFGLTYRTFLGNDVDGTDHGYQIHLIYNALASPTNQDNQTLSDEDSPIEFSWSLTSTPPEINGIFKPTAHLIIDSRDTDPDLLLLLEDILYGSESMTPSLPPQHEIVELYQDLTIFEVVLIDPDTYRVIGSAVDILPDDEFSMGHESITDNEDGSFTILF